MTDWANARSIRPIKWGRVSPTPDGRWKTDWRIELVQPADVRSLEMVAESLEPTDFRALVSVDGTSVETVVLTARDAMDIDLMAATHEMFLQIERELGRIATIEGTPRDWWRAFRANPGPDGPTPNRPTAS